ncbi:hypothetical protein IMY05_006G0088800 [Salix suchowensis]|nr:hypothetical protein IMY05_006G0088800 [Salix suchowensis]
MHTEGDAFLARVMALTCSIDFASSGELVVHVPVFPIMITTAPSYFASSPALQIGESPVQALNPCMQKRNNNNNYQQARSSLIP